MEKKQQTHFKAKLEAMSQDILDEAEKTLLEMTDQSDNYPDPADRATGFQVGELRGIFWAEFAVD